MTKRIPTPASQIKRLIHKIHKLPKCDLEIFVERVVCICYREADGEFNIDKNLGSDEILDVVNLVNEFNLEPEDPDA